MSIPQIGTKIWANIVRPGFIVRMPDGEQIEVVNVTTGYNTVTLDNGCGRAATCDYAGQVEVLGYFNP